MSRERPLRSARYAEIVHQCTLLFSEVGYERATVRMLAERLGIQAGSLYSHISSKEEVLYWIILDVAEDFFERGRAAVDAADTAVEQIRALCRSHMHVICEKRLAVQVYFSEWQKLDEFHQEEIVGLRDEYESLLKSLVTFGNEAGDLDCDPGFSSRLILSALNSTTTWYSPSGPLTPENVADLVIQTFFNGLVPRAEVDRALSFVSKDELIEVLARPAT